MFVDRLGRNRWNLLPYLGDKIYLIDQKIEKNWFFALSRRKTIANTLLNILHLSLFHVFESLVRLEIYCDVFHQDKKHRNPVTLIEIFASITKGIWCKHETSYLSTKTELHEWSHIIAKNNIILDVEINNKQTSTSQFRLYTL